MVGDQVDQTDLKEVEQKSVDTTIQRASRLLMFVLLYRTASYFIVQWTHEVEK